MMRWENNIVLLTRQEIAQAGYSIEALKQLTKRGIVKPASRGDYPFNQLPSHVQQMVKAHNWGGLEPHEWLAVQERAAVTQVVNSLERRISEVLEGGYAPFLPQYRDTVGMHHARALAQGAAVLHLVHGWLGEQGATAKKLTLVEQAAQLITPLGVPYLPSNARRLQEKLKAYAEGEALQSLVKLPRVGNNNAATVKTDADIEAWVLALRAHGANVSNAQIMRKVAQMCALEEKKVPSEGWFKSFLAKPATKMLTAAGRYNEGSRHAATYVQHVKLQRALNPGDCWQMDGTRMNMIAHSAGTLDKKVAGRKEQYPYVVGCMDVHSGAFVGVHLDYTEDRWAYISCLKMAIATAGYLPYELVLDRFPGHNTPEWKRVEDGLKACGVKVTYAKTAQGKAQIERSLKTVQDVFLSESAYAYGQGIKSSLPAAHRTEAYINEATKAARKRGGWDFMAALVECAQVFSNYHHTPLSAYSKRKLDTTPWQLLTEGEAPAALPASPRATADLFGYERQAMLKSGYLLVQVEKQEVPLHVNDGCTYIGVADAATLLRAYSGVTLRVVMDAELQRAWVYCPSTGKCLAEVPRYQPVLVHGPNAELGRLSSARAEQKQLAAQNKAELERVRARVGQLSPVKELTSPNEVNLLRPRTIPKSEQEEAENGFTPGYGFHPYSSGQEGGLLE